MKETALQSSVLPSGFKATLYCLKVDDNISEENFRLACNSITQLVNFASNSMFYWIGDLINAGERLFPSKYEQWIETTSYSIGYLRNAAWVCAHVPPDVREQCPTIQHAMALAKVPPESQKEVVKKIAEESLSATELRRFLSGDPNYKRKLVPDKIEPKKTCEGEFEKFWNAEQAKLTAVDDMRTLVWYVWSSAWKATKGGYHE